ncbi:MAG: hypothetical protein WBZ36_24545 [Candidatus Nitrosopolaris sp.]
MSQGSSYILNSTKNLQTQYKTDFGFLQLAKGRNNFVCEKLRDRYSIDINIDRKFLTADQVPCLDQTYKCELKTNIKDYYTSQTGTIGR